MRSSLKVLFENCKSSTIVKHSEHFSEQGIPNWMDFSVAQGLLNLGVPE